MQNNYIITNFRGTDYVIIQKGQEITKDLFNIAFGPQSGDITKIKLDSDQFYHILFLDGFDQTIHEGFIQRRVEHVALCDIKKPLIKGSLPNGVSELTLGNGFSHPLTNEVLPEFLRIVRIGDIKTKLTKDTFSGGIRVRLELLNGFDQLLEAGDLPECPEIEVNKINKPLKKGVIREGVKYLKIHNGFNQEIEAGALPQSLKYLSIYDIGSSVLKPGTIPNVPLIIKFEKGFNCSIEQGVIPVNCEEVSFETDKQTMERVSIPECVVRFRNGQIRSIADDEGEGGAITFQEKEKAHRQSIRSNNN